MVGLYLSERLKTELAHWCSDNGGSICTLAHLLSSMHKQEHAMAASTIIFSCSSAKMNFEIVTYAYLFAY